MQDSGSLRFSPVFSSRNFVVMMFELRSMTHLKLIFVYSEVKVKSYVFFICLPTTQSPIVFHKVYIFAYGYPNFLIPFIEKIVLSLLISWKSVGHVCVDQLLNHLFYPIDYMSTSRPALKGLDYCWCSNWVLKSDSVNLPILFFFKVDTGILGLCNSI